MSSQRLSPSGPISNNITNYGSIQLADEVVPANDTNSILISGVTDLANEDIVQLKQLSAPTGLVVVGVSTVLGGSIRAIVANLTGGNLNTGTSTIVNVTVLRKK